MEPGWPQPSMTMWRSLPHTPQWPTSIRTSWGPSSGRGRSARASDRGPRYTAAGIRAGRVAMGAEQGGRAPVGVSTEGRPASGAGPHELVDAPEDAAGLFRQGDLPSQHPAAADDVGAALDDQGPEAADGRGAASDY